MVQSEHQVDDDGQNQGCHQHQQNSRTLHTDSNWVRVVGQKGGVTIYSLFLSLREEIKKPVVNPCWGLHQISQQKKALSLLIYHIKKIIMRNGEE